MTIRSDRVRTLAASFALACSAFVASAPARADEPTPPAAPATDPLGPLRERFREGMQRYQAGAYGDAIVIWEAVYRELGPDVGYRLVFNLARAYDALGDVLSAAEHYASYVESVARRRAGGEALEPNVERQESQAKARLSEIAAVKGRIHVGATEPPLVVRIDNAPPRFAGSTTWVEPGRHTVRLGNRGDDADVRDVFVAAGAMVTVEPHVSRAQPPPATTAPREDSATTASAPRMEMRTMHPFSPVVVWTSGAVAALSVILPLVTYANALAIKSDYDAAATPRAEKERLAIDYASARTNAYASVALPSVLVFTTGALAIWYALGAREVAIPVSAGVSRTGATVTFDARF